MRSDIMKTTEVMMRFISVSEDRVVEALIARGYSRLRAELLVAFVPLGLGRAVIERLNAEPPIILPDIALVQGISSDSMLEISLAAVPEFKTALQLGKETFYTGIIPRAQFSASCNSVELNLINKALNAGHKLGGSRIAPPLLLRLADVKGFEQWYESLLPSF